MDWEKPCITVIDMNAEIGAYQADFEDVPADGPYLSLGPKPAAQAECAPELAQLSGE